MESKSPPGPIDFDTVSSDAPAEAVTCTSCKREITDAYFEAGGKVICGTCRSVIEAHLAPATGRSRRFGKAFGFGLLGAIAGSAIYYIVREITGYEIGLVAIVVGHLVGRGVFHGSGKRGGRRYQILAVVLTYFAMASTYVPAAVEAMKEGKFGAADSSAVTKDTVSAAKDSNGALAPAADSAAARSSGKRAVRDSTAVAPTIGGLILVVLALIALVAALPVLVIASSFLTVVFLAIALMQAWKMNRAVKISITGPYQIGGTHTPAAAT